MRPVTRGAHPERDGQRVEFAKYGDALQPLLDRLGDYCSYCELPLKNAPNVEHVQPKSKVIALREAWSNLLLACNYCNPHKGDRAIHIEDYFWPDLDNTLRMFEYREGGLIGVGDALDDVHKRRALRTRDLFGLNRLPGGKHSSTAGDRRWMHRRQAWDLARRYCEKVLRGPNPEMRECAVDVAVENGHFSIWMTVFADDPTTRRLLIEAFRGTASDCFDTLTVALVARPNGAL